MSRLNVELYGTLLGTLSQNDKWFDFVADVDVFAKYQLSSTIMSLAVPLLLRYSNAQKKRSAIFFAELLPEGRNFDRLAQTLPRSDRNLYGMLRKYGKDIAGALTIYDPEDPASSKKPEAEPVDGIKIRYLLENMAEAPLANSPVSGKTSLGGVQGKILLAKKDNEWYRVHNGYPSTHILKPVVPEYPTMIYDEAFCMKLAYNSGLTDHPVWIENFNGSDALVIERYDRDKNAVGSRIHQEDFNQALGLRGSEKYQEYSGKVSAKRIAQTLSRFGTGEDVRKFASQLIFSAAIGNLDMHAKNISILHHPNETISISPVYDQVPLRHQNTDGRLAMSIGGEYLHENLTLKLIATELASWQCAPFSDESETLGFITDCLKTYNNALENTPASDKAYPKLKTDIAFFINKLLLYMKGGRI